MYFPGLRLQERQNSHAPCPNGNGTMIGDEQQFVVYCDTRFRGDEVFRQKADSLIACAEMCTSFQNPRCEGAEFGGNKDCVLLGNLVPQGTRPSRFFDSAAAVLPQPGPTSSCSQQGTGTTFLSQSTSFTLQCGKIVNGKDLEQQFQMTLESCLAACSANPACGGVTFDPQQTAGFRNCYLKTTIDAADLFAKTGVDSAVIVNNANQAANGNIAGDASTSVIASIPSDTISQPTAFITVVPNQGAASSNVVTVSVPVPVTSTSSTGALADSTPEASAGAASTGTGNGRGGANNSSERPKFGNVGSSNSSNAWIAAPVIGGIAALTLILAVFVLWGRRRRRDNSPPRNGRPGPMSRRATLSNFGKGLGDAANRFSRGRVFGSEKTRLGSSDLDDDDDESRYGTNRGGFKVVSGSGRRLGLNGQEIPGTGPGLGGMIVTTGGGRVVNVNAGGARSSSPAGSAGLRDSQNGLRQNRLTGNWLDSQPGIPAEFRGPDLK
ncbi:hypothetical protein F4801DRAFT_587970 [Xylaria longipes]|nr:hypothetical protein F4801DRAFT_587970 [Xylaria longipes]